MMKMQIYLRQIIMGMIVEKTTFERCRQAKKQAVFMRQLKIMIANITLQILTCENIYHNCAFLDAST